MLVCLSICLYILHLICTGCRYCRCTDTYKDTDELHKRERREAYVKACEKYFGGVQDADNVISKLGIDKLLEDPEQKPMV